MKNKKQLGISVIEVVLASAMFVIFAAAAVTALLQNYSANRLGGEYTIASQFASEGLEAVRSIKNRGFSNLNTALGGVARSGGLWVFSGTSNVFTSGKTYTRTLAVTSVQRDCSTGEIVESGSQTYIDPDFKKVTSTVNWEFNPDSPGSRAESLAFATYFTNWKAAIPPSSGGVGGGMLFYGNGGTSSEALQYKVLDSATGVWSDAQNIDNFDGDAAITNRALRAVRLDSSSTRNEKIALARHYRSTGTEQSIWGHTWDGSAWRSAMLTSWSSSANLDVRNFDGVYLEDGTYMAVYSDGSSVPKYRFWDGNCWGDEQQLVDLADNGSSAPLYIVTKRRPGTSEVMAVFFGTARDTNTQYFNGASWTLHSQHSNNGPGNREMIDFAWSPQNPLKGFLVYNSHASGVNSRRINGKVFTADGLGGGTWVDADQSDTTGNTLRAMTIDARLGAEEAVSCTSNNANDIYCFRLDSSPAWSTPANNIITANTDTGVQRSFDFGFEALTGDEGIVVYSDNTATPRIKRFIASSNTFTTSAVNINALGGILETVRLKAQPGTNDIMIVLADTNNDLFTRVWNGTSNSLYSSPSGKNFSSHGTSGAGDVNYWFDFAWDRF